MRRSLLLLSLIMPLAASSCGSNVPDANESSSQTAVTVPKVTAPSTLPTTEPTTIPEPSAAEKILSDMTLHEKVCQLFIVIPEALNNGELFTSVNDNFAENCRQYPVGGFIFFDKNIIDQTQTDSMINGVKQAMRETGTGCFISVDEEGGDITRLQYPLGLNPINQMYVYGEQNNKDTMRADAAYIGQYMSEHGFSLDFAPVADVEICVYNELQTRIFSSDPQIVADMSAAYVEGLHSAGICSALKHFPGLGAGSGNTHYDTVVIDRTVNDLRETEFPAFYGGIRAGSDFVMVGHQITTGSGDNLPGDLSKVVVTDWLRNELDFTELIITDSHSMGAIINNYTSSDAAVMALEAGVDMILMPYDLTDAVNGVETAVKSGRLSEKRINESVLRILEKKDSYGLL